MKKMLANFANSLLSTDQMKKVKGGYEWNHSWKCWCGMTYYEGSGDLDVYRGAASSNCSSGQPVNCRFDGQGWG